MRKNGKKNVIKLIGRNFQFSFYKHFFESIFFSWTLRFEIESMEGKMEGNEANKRKRWEVAMSWRVKAAKGTKSRRWGKARETFLS